MPPLPPVTQALMLICTAVFCLQRLIPGTLEPFLALWPLPAGFLPWQLVTYVLVDGDLMGLMFSMLGMWMFGGELERLWGRTRFLQMVAVSGLMAGLFGLLGGWLLGALSVQMGLSGVLFGFLLSYALVFPDRTIMPLIPPIPMKAPIAVAVFALIALLFGLAGGSGGLVHIIHLAGGTLGAWLLIGYWRGSLPLGRRRR